MRIHPMAYVAGSILMAGITIGTASSRAVAEEPLSCGGEPVTIDLTAAEHPDPDREASDVIWGTPGDDVIDSGLGADTVCGGGGNDRITGATTAIGGDGDDQIHSDFVADGGAGDDQLHLEGGLAYLRPGPGADVVHLSSGVRSVTVNYSDLSTPVEADFAAESPTVKEIGTAYVDLFLSAEGSSRWREDGIAFEGTGGADLIRATDGYDAIYAGSGDDHVQTLDGGDLVNPGDGNDVVDGGPEPEGKEPDRVTFAGSDAGVHVDLGAGLASGGSGNDTIIDFENVDGSAHDDVLSAPPGRTNRLSGGGGGDTFPVAGLEDEFYGGPGDDVISFAAWSTGVDLSETPVTTGAVEWVKGSGHDDVLVGGYGQSLAGEAGDDVILPNGDMVADGGGGTDTLSYANREFPRGYAMGIDVSLAVTGPQVVRRFDGAAHETQTIRDFENLIGSPGLDNLTGSDGPNVIDGLGYDDSSLGGHGDEIHGKGGNDTLVAGASDDTLYPGSGNDVVDGGTGHDAVSYDDAAAGVRVGLGGLSVPGTQASGNDILRGAERLVGSRYADTLFGDSGDNEIMGRHGPDVIHPAGGVDVVYGHDDGSYSYDDAIDTVSYSESSAGIATDLMKGTLGEGIASGIDNVIGSRFADAITGSYGANVITAGGGDDMISGGDGNDHIDGGAGADRIVGGGGTDLVTYGTASAGVRVNLSTTARQDTVGAGWDTIASVENVAGSAHADSLTGTPGTNVIDGGAGNDTLTGSGGNDRLQGGNGTDTASYASASASVKVSPTRATGGAGTDVMTGVENLAGSKYSDTLSGDSGANLLRGNSGNDVILPGAGNDKVYGGSGVDTLSYASISRPLSVSMGLTSAQNTGGAGTDLISAFERLIGGSGLDVLVGGPVSEVITGGAGNDRVHGNGGNDVIRGGVGYDVVLGGAGADELHGDGGNDTLRGGAGNDRVYGEAGADKLYGDGGADVLFGGPGQDSGFGGPGRDSSIAVERRISIP
ncbi:calcium-binding protein [Nocardioides sp. NPDC087217]|uniref:calcium-binding protein n=1 Tax=Nocardioides sp. NPDC087217 TaxID=3364335 RepID=UPI0038043C5C